MPSSELIPFVFDGRSVRVMEDEEGNPWFVAKDVALALGYDWSGITTIKHVPEEWRRVESVSTHRRGEQETWLLSEQGLYFFLGRSDKAAALPFQKWLAGEVLPALLFPVLALTSIRQIGTLKFPNRTGVTVAFAMPHMATKSVFFRSCHQSTSRGVGHILARRRPGVREAPAAVRAGERRLAFFCAQNP